LDLVDGTPVIDVKPYLPFAESIPDARAGYAQTEPPAALVITFTTQVREQLRNLASRYPDLERFIVEVLSQDPRPAYRKSEAPGKTYAVLLADFNVRWRITGAGAEVFALEPR
jgi:hypothetical protein